MREAPAALDTEQKKLGSRRSLEAEEEGKEGTNLEEDHVPGLQHLPPVFSLVGFHGDRVRTVADDQVVHLGTQSVHLIFVLVFKDKLVNRGSHIAHHLRIKSCESPSDRSSPVVSYNTAPLHAKALK